ncbi:MAG: glucose-1-phosphate adenylyltransferase, partial [Planctomycetes bacterium]|nr:glucose-1-phosphate adenylyltransferase [Planctomycetota bacterium]
SHDFAKDVIPAMIEKDDRVFGYRFKGVESGGSGFWRDVGTLDIYWQTHMQLVGGAPPIDLHDEGWPLRTYAHGMPPVKSMCTARNRFEQIESSCQSQLHNVLVSDGCVVDSASIKNSVLGRGVHVASGVEIEGSVIMEGVKIGENARIRQAVIDKHNEIPAGYKVGIDPEQDHRHFSVSDGGIVVVPKEMPLFRPDRKSDTSPD